MNNQLNILVNKAKVSTFWLWIFNIVLHRVIPFNAPHKIKVTSITNNSITTFLPLIRKNQNHLKGMHACALGTVCEYSCGLLLISRLDPSKYRLIMKTLHMDYHQQAKTAVQVRYELSEELINKFKSQLTESPTLLEKFELTATNISGEIVCTATMEWQLKRWDKIHKN